MAKRRPRRRAVRPSRRQHPGAHRAAGAGIGRRRDSRRVRPAPRTRPGRRARAVVVGALVAVVVPAPRRPPAVARRPPLLHARAGRSAHSVAAAGSDVPRPPHRPDDRRVGQHGDAVSRRASQRERAERGELLHDRRRGGNLHPAADQRQIPRPHLAHRIRRRSLRRHAVHQRLRQRPVEPLARRRLDRVHEIFRSGHDDRPGDRSVACRCSARSIS